MAPSHFLKQCWIIVNWTLITNFSEISIAIETFSFKKMHLKISSAKWRPFCLGFNVLICSREWCVSTLCECHMSIMDQQLDCLFNTRLTSKNISMHLIAYDDWFGFMPIVIPLAQRSCWGVYWFHYVCPSVSPSVRPSRIPCPLCSTYNSGWIHFIFLHLIKQLQKVCRVYIFVQNFKIWLFGDFFKFLTSTSSFLGLGSDVNH